MAIEVFNRYENKYLVDDAGMERLQLTLKDRMILDPYNEKKPAYAISNLYYDTDDSFLIRTSLQKPTYKEKLRLRAYGVPGLQDKVFVEIKKKVCGVVNKRRSAMLLADAYAFLETGILPDPQPLNNRQVLREIAYFLNQHDLKPMLYLTYDRRAYFGMDEPGLRISFDCNIRTRRSDLRLEAGDHGELLLPAGQWLMEIKTARGIPFWLSRLLAEQRIYPVSFSKYGREYHQRSVQLALERIFDSKLNIERTSRCLIPFSTLPPIPQTPPSPSATC